MDSYGGSAIDHIASAAPSRVPLYLLGRPNGRLPSEAVARMSECGYRRTTASWPFSAVAGGGTVRCMPLAKRNPEPVSGASG
jgi:hypothetical protein